MAKTHWKKLINLDYLGAYALEEGEDLTLTIDNVRQETVTGNNGKKEQCMVCHFKEDVKPFIVNRTNAKTITKVCGSPYLEDWRGHAITLYADTTRLGADIVECLRVRPFAPKVSDKVLKCESCGKSISGKGSMSAAEVAAYTKQKFGRQLCSDCAKKAQEES